MISRQEAKASGLVRYFTGKACKHGHIAERQVSDRTCRECASVKSVSYKARNRDKVNSWKRVWNKANRKKVSAHWKELYQSSPELREKHVLRVADWARRNLGRKAAIEGRRRSVKIGSTPKWADIDAIRVIYEAASRDRMNGLDVEVDHIIPLQGKYVCGLHVHNNLQVLVATANRRKHNSFFEGDHDEL